MKSREQYIQDLAPKRYTKVEKIWLFVLIVFIVAGMVAYIDQVVSGLEVTNLNDYALLVVKLSYGQRLPIF